MTGFIKELWEEQRSAGGYQRDFLSGITGGALQRDTAGLGAIGKAAHTFSSGARGIAGFGLSGLGGMLGVGAEGAAAGSAAAATGPALAMKDLHRLHGWGVERRTARRAETLAAGGTIGFGLRTGGEHLQQGAKNFLKYGVLSPLSWGINFMFGAAGSGDNPLSPHGGLAKGVVGAMANEAGFTVGGALGAAALSALLPGVGFVVGGLVGAGVAESLADIPWKMAEFGAEHGRMAVHKKSTFIDSDAAATMRQRAMQSIRRNQLNARSSMGSEALAYHS